MKIHKHLFVSFLMLFGIALSGRANVAPAEAAINSSNLRIFVDRSNWENDSAIVKLEYGTSLDATNTIESVSGTLADPTGYIENSAMTRWYAMYDVPTTIIGQEFVLRRYNSASTELWNSSLKYTFTEGMNNQMWYIWDNWSGTVSQGSVDNTNGAFLKYVIEGYMTCSENISNGFLAYPTLLSTYFMNGETARYSDDLSDDLVDDFSVEANYTSGTKTEDFTNVEDKIDMMRIMHEQYLLENPESLVASQSVVVKFGLTHIIVMTSIMLIIAVGYYSISKKFRIQ